MDDACFDPRRRNRLRTTTERVALLCLLWQPSGWWLVSGMITAVGAPVICSWPCAWRLSMLTPTTMPIKGADTHTKSRYFHRVWYVVL